MRDGKNVSDTSMKSSPVVVDASALVEVLFLFAKADAVLKRLDASHAILHAPDVLDLEIAHALRRRWLAGEIDEARGLDALRRFEQLDIIRHPHLPLLDRVWALRHNLTAYDASYVALAELLGAPLVTRDGRLARSAGHAAAIELIA